MNKSAVVSLPRPCERQPALSTSLCVQGFEKRLYGNSAEPVIFKHPCSDGLKCAFMGGVPVIVPVASNDDAAPEENRKRSRCTAKKYRASEFLQLSFRW